MSLPTEVETRLLYETLGSEFVARSLHASRLGVGEWRRGHNHVNADKNLVQEYFNIGVPVTIELTRLADGSLVKTRERSTFVWEKSFEPFDSWLPSADWMDGVMFRSTLPQDFIVGLAATESRKAFANGVHNNIAIYHFQPVRYRRLGTYDPSYDDPVEIEQTFANVGMTIDAFQTETNYYTFQSHGRTVQNTNRMLTQMGFVCDGTWMTPPGERHQKLRELFLKNYC